jgi:hypothetical protein
VPLFLLLPPFDLYLVKITSMLAVKGIYDGSRIQLLEKIKDHKRYKVIITFVEEMKGSNEENELRSFSAQSKGLEFWEDKREDIYQDYLHKSKRAKK